MRCRIATFLFSFLSCCLVGSQCLKSDNPPLNLIQRREISTKQVPSIADFEHNETLIFNNFTVSEPLPADEPNYNELGVFPIQQEANKTSDHGIETVARLPSPPYSDKMPLFHAKSPVEPLSNETFNLGIFPLANARNPQPRPTNGFTGSRMPAITGNGGGGEQNRVSKRRKKTTTATTRKRLRKRKTTTSRTTSTTSSKKVRRTTITSKLES